MLRRSVIACLSLAVVVLYAYGCWREYGAVHRGADAREPITVMKPDGAIEPPPLSAIAVSQCGLAVALFIQLDAGHLLRADPRQSDLFTAVGGKMEQSTAGPMPWDTAIDLAGKAVLTTHLTLPCTDGPGV